MSENKENKVLEFFGDDGNILLIFGCLWGPLCVVLFWYIDQHLNLTGYPEGTLGIINWGVSGVLVFITLLSSFFLSRMDGLVKYKFASLLMFYIFILTSASVTGLILNFGWPWLRIVYSVIVFIVFVFAVFMTRITIMDDI
jgi:hypothetical protein